MDIRRRCKPKLRWIDAIDLDFMLLKSDNSRISVQNKDAWRHLKKMMSYTALSSENVVTGKNVYICNNMWNIQ